MRKAIPFVLTVVVSMLCTATLVRAAGSSGETALQPSSVAPSELLGSGLDLNKCNNSPKNATEWTRFAKCMTGNVFKVRQWAKVLDTCLHDLPGDRPRRTTSTATLPTPSRSRIIPA